jgi:allantoicase
MARLRVSGRPTAAARASLAARFLRLLPEAQLAGLLQAAGLSAAEAGRLAGDLSGDLAGDLAGDLMGNLPSALREQLRLRS